MLAVYAAGYERTSPAAEQLESQSVVRRPVSVSAARTPARPEAPLAASSAPALQPQKQQETEREVASLVPPSALAPAPVETPASQPKTEVTPAAPAPAPVPVSPAPEPATPVPSPAIVAVPATPAVPAAPQTAAQYKDGTYKGWGTCRHGDIEAQVVIEGGRITSASISQCLTRYSCDVIGRLPPEVVQRQSAEVDYVSGATQSANAFYYAVLGALGKAK